MDVPIRGWTFTHWWVRPVVNTWFNIYHQSITYSGTDHIEWEKPLIFAPSHQNAFSDALCLIVPTQYSNNRFIYPLIRADAFGNSKSLDWLLTSFHMMPVYRPRDNVALKQKNRSVFDGCYDVLAKKRNLLIHPEGNCIPQKYVRTFKKGLSRIALGAEEAHDFNLGVQVIPVGINYRQITGARKGIHIRYGEPITVSGFADVYRQHPASAVTQLTRKTQQGVENVTVNIKPGKHYQLSETLMQLVKSLHSTSFGNTAYTKEEVKTYQQVEEGLQKKSPEGINGLEDKVEKLRSFMEKYKLRIGSPLAGKTSLPVLLLSALGFIILSPVILYGWFNNIIPWHLMNRVGDMVTELQFKSSARMVSGLLLFPVMYLLQAAIVFIVSESWGWTLCYLISLPFAGLVCLNSLEKLKDWSQLLRLSLMPQNKKKELYDLVEDIRTITDRGLW